MERNSRWASGFPIIFVWQLKNILDAYYKAYSLSSFDMHVYIWVLFFNKISELGSFEKAINGKNINRE